VGAVPLNLAAELQQALALARAVETGTYLGEGARRLARIFPRVVTIELSDELFAQAQSSLRDEPAIETLHGDSRTLLAGLVDPAVATLFFLDGHWSGGCTAGADAECPVLDELGALRGGNPNDCLVIDDARLFTAPPPPPHDPSHWPTLTDVLDAVRASWPQHHVTLLAGQVIAVPTTAKPLVDRYGQALADALPEHPGRSRRPIAWLTGMLRRGRSESALSHRRFR
jgi:hypothetical protein